MNLTTFLGYGGELLSWMINGFKSIIEFGLENPIIFWGLIVSIVGTLFVYLRSTIGG